MAKASTFQIRILKQKKWDPSKPDSSETWADFVLKNRGNSSNEQVHDYDLIYGPIADDNVGVQLRKYHKEEITFEEFLKKLKFPKGITFQYSFATEKAISKLKRL